MLKEIKVFFSRCKTAWFPTADDRAWKQWVNQEERKANDLVALLLSDEFGDSFKKRALFLLFVPAIDLNPLYWKGKVGEFNYKLDFLEKLSPNLLAYAVEIIEDFYLILSPMHCAKPTKSVLRTCGLAVEIFVLGKYARAFSFYNESILFLLANLNKIRETRILHLTQAMLNKFGEEEKDLLQKVEESLRKSKNRP